VLAIARFFGNYRKIIQPKFAKCARCIKKRKFLAFFCRKICKYHFFFVIL
jgi:hypothetical protein